MDIPLQWNSKWASDEGEGILYPASHNEFIAATLERYYSQTNKLALNIDFLQDGGILTADFWDSGVYNSITQWLETTARSYFENHILNTTPPTKWTPSAILAQIGSNPGNALVGYPNAKRLFYVYQLVNLMRRIYESAISASGTMSTATRSTTYTELVPDVMEWDIYRTSDITIDGTPYTRGNSYTLWTNQPTKVIRDVSGDEVTGQAHTMKINVIASAGNYSRGRGDVTNGFKFKDW